MFRDRYLQDPMMTELKVVANGNFMLTMHFDRFDPDDEDRCIFENKKAGRRVAWPAFCRIGPYFDWYRGRGPAADDYGGHFEAPNHVLRVKNVINDTELPGLEYDLEKQEVSFRWREMFMHLYQEEAVVESRLDEWMQSLLRSDVTTNMPPVLTQIKRWNDQRDDIRCLVRQKRVHVWYTNHINNSIYENCMDQIDYELAKCHERIEHVRLQFGNVDFPEDADETRARLAQEAQEIEEGIAEGTVDFDSD